MHLALPHGGVEQSHHAGAGAIIELRHVALRGCRVAAARSAGV